MSKQILMVALMLALAILLSPPTAQAQTSAIDTFKVLDAVAPPGARVPIKLFVVNDSIPLGSLIAYFRIDTNFVKFDGVYDTVPVTQEVNFEINFDLIDRALTVQNLFNYNRFMRTNDSVTATAIGLGFEGEIPRGRGNVWQFYLNIKPTATIGSSTQIRIYNPSDVPGDLRTCTYTDASGLSADIEPTLVIGTLKIDTTSAPPVGQNHPPVIAALATPINVQPNEPVSFSVSATDPDSPQHITLRGTGLPSGATFGTNGVVTGNGSAFGTFNWTPNIGQAGNFYDVIFTCTDDSNAAVSRTVRINVGVPHVDEDLLFSASSKTYRLFSGGIPGLTGLAIPVNLADINSIYGVQFDFIYDNNVMVIDSLIQTGRLENFTVYDNVGSSPGRVRVVAFGLNNQKVQTDTTSAIFNFWVSVKANAPTGESPISFENAWEAISPLPSVASVKLTFDTTGVFIVDQMGDVNGDGRVDVADAVVTVSYIIGSQSLSYRQFNAADQDRNASVDVVDLVAIINIIFGGLPGTSPSWSGPEAVVRLGNDEGLINAENIIEINADLPTNIAGVQLEIGYNSAKVWPMIPRKTALAENLNFRFHDDGRGKLVLLLYPRAGMASHIEAGKGTVIKLPVIRAGELSPDGKDIRITSAVLSDPSAVAVPVKGLGRPNLPSDFTLEQNFPNPFNPETTIEFAISTNSALKPVRLMIYNVLGERVATLLDGPLAAGRYSYRWQGSSDKGKTAASGVYFYRLTVGNQAQTKKMVLLK